MFQGRLLLFSTFLIMILSLSACHHPPKQYSRRTFGIVMSEYLSHTPQASPMPFETCGLLGEEIGKSMDEEDHIKIRTALSTQQTMTWTNPKYKRSYRFEPTDKVYVRSYRHCQNYYCIVETEGERQLRVHGTSCRNQSGKWIVINRY